MSDFSEGSGSQVASDVTCIPESRVNDMVMPPDLIDRDIPAKIKIDGFERVCEYILSMIRCKHAGNFESFREEYYRPPAKIFEDKAGSQHFIIYRTGRSSDKINPDLWLILQDHPPRIKSRMGLAKTRIRITART